MSVTGIQEPTKAGVAVVDADRPARRISAVTAALTHRNGTGRGQRIEVSCSAACWSPLVNQSKWRTWGRDGADPMARNPSIAPYEVCHGRPPHDHRGWETTDTHGWGPRRRGAGR